MVNFLERNTSPPLGSQGQRLWLCLNTDPTFCVRLSTRVFLEHQSGFSENFLKFKENSIFLNNFGLNSKKTIKSSPWRLGTAWEHSRVTQGMSQPKETGLLLERNPTLPLKPQGQRVQYTGFSLSSWASLGLLWNFDPTFFTRLLTVMGDMRPS